jgi:hypothetical protein
VLIKTLPFGRLNHALPDQDQLIPVTPDTLPWQKPDGVTYLAPAAQTLANIVSDAVRRRVESIPVRV